MGMKIKKCEEIMNVFENEENVVKLAKVAKATRAVSFTARIAAVGFAAYQSFQLIQSRDWFPCGDVIYNPEFLEAVEHAFEIIREVIH